jgi:hypothetical protein
MVFESASERPNAESSASSEMGLKALENFGSSEERDSEMSKIAIAR